MRWLLVTRVQRLWRPWRRLGHARAGLLAAPSLLLLVSVARQPRVSVEPLAGPSQPSLASAAQPLPASVELLAPSLPSASPPYPAPCACRTRSGRVLFG